MGELTHRDGLVVETRAIIERKIEDSIMYFNILNVCLVDFFER